MSGASEDRLLAVAAGVVFYGLLAVFPAITALVSLYGLFAKASTISEHLSMAGGILPAGTVNLVQDQVNQLIAKGDAKLSFGFVFGLGIALWSANAGMKAIMDALNVVYEEKEKRGFIKLNLLSLAFTIAAISSLLLAIGAVVVLPLVLSYLELQTFTNVLFRLSRWPILLVVVVLGLAVLYRFGPSRREPRWQWISLGSLLAALAWLAASILLSWYLTNFANYDATYGSLGAAIGMMMWMWVSSIVILFGAELNSEIEHQTTHDSTVDVTKVLEGGYVPLLLAAAVYGVMWIWHRGTSAVRARVIADEVPLKKFVETIGSHDIARVPGSAVFLTRADSETPPVLVWHVRKNRSLHEYVLILKLVVTSSPRTKPSERLQIERIADKLWRIEARHGFMERPNVLAVLDDCRTKGVEMNRDDVTFYVGHETIIPREGRRGIPRWQEAIFAAMARNSVRITDVLKLPHNQVVEIGREIAI